MPDAGPDQPPGGGRGHALTLLPDVPQHLHAPGWAGCGGRAEAGAWPHQWAPVIREVIILSGAGGHTRYVTVLSQAFACE